MNFADFRETPLEQLRIADLLTHVRRSQRTALDVGTRDGYLAIRLADHFAKVTALDLIEPKIEHPKIHCVRGDVSSLQFADNSFDLVVCAEVLEHLPEGQLASACRELSRVSSSHVL